MKNTFNKSTIIKSAAASILLAGMTAGVAQALTFDALLTLVKPISLTQTDQMHLGSILAEDADTCTLGVAGARTGAACFGAAAGTLGTLTVEGTAGLQFNIALADGASTGSELTFSPSLLNNGTGSNTLTGVTLLGGSQPLTLGGTVTVVNGDLAVSNLVDHVSYEVSVTYQ